MSKVVPDTMSAEEFERLYLGKPAELIRGKVRETMPAGRRHGKVAMTIGAEIATFVRRHNLGETFAAETGFVLRTVRGESVRAPDVAFIRKERLVEEEEGFSQIVPDLVVEVVSPQDTPTYLSDKVNEWLEAGVAVVWVIDPKQRRVEVWQADGTHQLLEEGAILSGEPVLPRFQIPVRSLFE